MSPQFAHRFSATRMQCRTPAFERAIGRLPIGVRGSGGPQDGQKSVPLFSSSTSGRLSEGPPGPGWLEGS
jgi:hypothetical protein